MLRGKRTFVTLLSTDDFFPGVLMLEWSLRQVGSQYPLLVLCGNVVSGKVMDGLRERQLICQQLHEHINPKEGVNQEREYHHWSQTFDKLYVWNLTQYEKVVFLDADMQVIRNIDYLFDCPHMSAVCADAFNEPGLDKLNSGLMVIEPNEREFEELRTIVKSGELHLKNMGDQDVIRAYYHDWGTRKELTLEPGLNVLYSEVSRGVIQRQDVEPVSVIHYIGHKKPWMVSPRAIIRRSKHNFLGKYLLRYAMVMFWKMPKLLIVGKIC